MWNASFNVGQKSLAGFLGSYVTALRDSCSFELFTLRFSKLHVSSKIIEKAIENVEGFKLVTNIWFFEVWSFIRSNQYSDTGLKPRSFLQCKMILEVLQIKKATRLIIFSMLLKQNMYVRYYESELQAQLIHTHHPKPKP